MASRNWIGRKTKKGAEYIYCHWGGYLDENGKILHENYTTNKLVQELISHGDASYIDKTLKESCFYARDRGEDKGKLVTDIDSNYRPNSATEYEPCFLWKKGRWWYSDLEETNGTWREITF